MDSKMTLIQNSLSSLSELEITYRINFSSNILPILDYLSQLFLPFQTFEFIQISFCVLQFLEASFWTQIGEFWGETKFANILHYIAFFSSMRPSKSERIILFCIFFAIIFINSGFLLFLIIHYSKTRRSYRPILVIFRIYYMVLGGVIIHPISSLMGHLLDFSISEHKASDIIMLILTFIIYVLAQILFYLNLRFVNQSIYIHKSLWITFDSTLLVFMFMWSPLFLFIGHLFKYYPFWTFYILCFCHIFIVILSFYRYIWMSCVHEVGNALQTSILCSYVFNDIFRICAEHSKKIQPNLYALICAVVFIVLSIVSFIIVKLIRKKINWDLSNSKLINPPSFADKDNLRAFDPTMEGKFTYFSEELKLNQNMKKAMIYLIVGFTSASDMFVDYSLIQYCIDNFMSDTRMIVLLIRLLSYFKAEKKRLDIVLIQFHSLRTDYIYGHFIYMQAHRIKVFRQVTSTNFSSTRLDELKRQTFDLENQIKSFWSLEEASTSTLDQMEKKQKHLNNMWDESVEENWSSVSFRGEHINFLIESCTDFQRAVKMENIKEKIDSLDRERDDLCFLSLLMCFPKYFEKKIIDPDGTFIGKKYKKESSGTSSGNSDEKHSSSSNSYDLTQEEQIANSILTFGRLRLAMQYALKNVKPKMNRILVIYSLFSIFASLILIITVFAVFMNSSDLFDDWNKEVGVVVDLRIAFMKSFLSLSIMAGKATDRFSVDHIDCYEYIDYNDNDLFMDLSTEFKELTLFYVDQSRKEFWNLMDAVLQLAMKKTDISSLTSILFDKTISSNICGNGKVIANEMWSMEKALNFEILSFSLLSADAENVGTWYSNNTYWCHDIKTFPSVEKMFTVIQNELNYDLSNSSLKNSNNIKIAMIIIGPAHFLIFVLPLPIFIFMYTKEINHLIKIMLLTDQDSKEQARKNISLLTPNENIETISSVSKISFNWKIFLFSFLVFIAFCCYILFVEMILFVSMKFTQDMRNLGFFTCYFSLLRSYLIEILIEIINAVYFATIPLDVMSNAEFKGRIYDILKAFENNIYVILNDTPECPSSVGRDSIVDQIVLNPFCEKENKITKLHDSYECASLNRLFSTIHSLIEKIVEEITIYNGVFAGEELSNLYHIIFVHLIPLTIGVENRFDEIQNNTISGYKSNLIAFFICGIVILIVWLFLLIFIISMFRRVFDMAICLIRRLPPVGFINNSELTNYILYKKSEEIEMGVTHTIFNSSSDGIICMNQDGIVEIINKSFATDYGYSPEQLVGQLIGSIFDNASREKLENQLKLIKNHESTGYTQDVTCYTNNGRAVPSFVTLFATKGSENSLILVIRDQTILLQKQKRLELAKKQSQDLLEQIMPQKVLFMLKQGKSEISFTVPSASVMFVDIVNFSKFSSALSPQQIMGTLSTLFGAFDIFIQKYPYMTKIKLIGDIYMAACGLFAKDEDKKNIAKQCIDFALHVLNILDDTNIKLNVSLQIRIGINSDGPIIAGVLGTENRVFDIIGDTINVASRLEHKAEPGHILMSEKTFNLVKDFNYRIIPKGEVFLKGKGNMKAYEI